MTGRAKIGFGDALGDLGNFAPTPRIKPTAPPPEVAAAAGFTSREAVPSPTTKGQRRHRTGRSAQINIKAKPETIQEFTAWADAHGMSIAEAFEVAIRKLSSSS